jgi:hypothetical protein
MEVEGKTGFLKNELAEQLQDEYPGAIVHQRLSKYNKFC